MRKVFLDDLPKWDKDSRYAGKIKWKGSVGRKVKFIYDDINGEIEILEYKNSYLKLKYLDEEITMYYSNLNHCNIGNLLGIKSTKYKFDVGTIIDDLSSGKLKILEQIRIERRSKKRNEKGYKYLCIVCGNIDYIFESHLNRKNGCNVCSKQKVLRGYNDLWTTHPSIACLLYDLEEGYYYSYGSDQRTDWKCPNCNNKIVDKRIADMVRVGVSCPRCSDGISYPEKVVYDLLFQMNVDFEYQKNFNWLKGKKYDFYISSLNCIIEVHGNQHFDENGFQTLNGLSLEDIQKNDEVKRIAAIENKINYIIIDASISDIDFIKNNIINSNLSKMISLSMVDWLKCHEFACNNSLVKTVCDMWNDGNKSTFDIAKNAKLFFTTVIRYLKRGAKIGWCNYSPDDGRKMGHKKATKINKEKKSKVVIRLTLDGSYIDEHPSTNEAARNLNIAQASISNACLGKQKTAYGFKWIYKEDYERLMLN